MTIRRVVPTLLVALLGLGFASQAQATPRKSAAQKKLEKALRFEARSHSDAASTAVRDLLRSGFLTRFLAKADEVRGQADAETITVDSRVMDAVNRFFAAEGRTPEEKCPDDGSCQAYRVKKVFLEGESESPDGPIQPVWRVIAEHQEEPDPATLVHGYEEIWVFRALTVDPATGTVEQWWGK